MKHEIQFVEICYKFTQDELNQLGPLIARLSQDEQEKVDEKKSAVADFNHQIAEIRREFNENVNRLNNGFEMRTVQARKVKNYRTGEFEFWDTDTFELVKTEPFKPGDYQRDLDDIEPDETPYGKPTDPTPEDNGTIDTNPTRYANLLRELTYWRNQLTTIAETLEGDTEIEAGLEITNKIKSLEAALKAMEPSVDSANPDTDDTSAESTNEQ